MNLNRGNLSLFILGSTASLLNATPPMLLGMSIDQYRAEEEFPLLLLGLAAFAMLGVPFTRLLARLYITRINRNTRRELKLAILHRLLNLGFNRTPDTYAVELIDNDVEHTMYSRHNVYLDIGFNASLIIFSLCIIASINLFLLIPPLLAIAYTALCCSSTRRLTATCYESVLYTNARIVNYMGDVVSRDRRLALNYLQRATPILKNRSIKTNLKLASMEALSSVSFMVGVTALFTTASLLLNSDSGSAGAIVAVLMYIERVLGPTSALVNIYYSLAEARCRDSRINSILGR